jgi:hypothetical protein
MINMTEARASNAWERRRSDGRLSKKKYAFYGGQSHVRLVANTTEHKTYAMKNMIEAKARDAWERRRSDGRLSNRYRCILWRAVSCLFGCEHDWAQTYAKARGAMRVDKAMGDLDLEP